MSTSGVNNENPAGTNSLSKPWFQLFWKISTGILIVLTIALIYKIRQYCKYHKKLRNVTALSSSPGLVTESTVITNQEALRMWGTTPGVIVTGRQADNVYRPADGLGQFGSSRVQEVIPELEHAASTLDQRLVVATRAQELSGGSDIVLEAMPYGIRRTD